MANTNRVYTRKKVNGVYVDSFYADYAKNKETGEKLGNKEKINFIFPIPKGKHKRSQLHISIPLLISLFAKWGHKATFSQEKFDRGQQELFGLQAFVWGPRSIEAIKGHLASDETPEEEIEGLKDLMAEKEAMIKTATENLGRLCSVEGYLSVEEVKAIVTQKDADQQAKKASGNGGDEVIDDLESLYSGIDFTVAEETEEAADLSTGI